MWKRCNSPSRCFNTLPSKQHEPCSMVWLKRYISMYFIFIVQNKVRPNATRTPFKYQPQFSIIHSKYQKKNQKKRENKTRSIHNRSIYTAECVDTFQISQGKPRERESALRVLKKPARILSRRTM